MTRHEELKRRRAGVKHRTPRPLLAQRVTVSAGAPLDLKTFNELGDAVAGRRKKAVQERRQLFNRTFSPLQMIIAGERRKAAKV